MALEYDIEELDGVVRPVVRLRLPEKIARTLVAEELPTLDRPLRFAVLRGNRGAVRAADLLTLQEKLDDPYTDEERETARRLREDVANRPRSSETHRTFPREGGGRHGGKGGGGNRGGGNRSGGNRGGGKRRGGRGR